MLWRAHRPTGPPHLDEWREQAPLGEAHHGRHNIVFSAGRQAVPVHLWMGAAAWADRVDPPDCRRQVSHTRCGAHCHPLCDRGRPPIGGPEATIDFVDVPTIAGWAPHKGVHDYLRTLPVCLAYARRSLTILSAPGRRMRSTRPGDVRSSGTRPMLGGSSSI